MPEDRLDRIEEILERVAKEQEEFAIEMQKLKEAQDRLEKSQAKTDEQIDKLRQAQAKTDEQIDKLRQAQTKTDENVGHLTGGWGKFVEGIALPSVMKVAEQINLRIEKRFWHAEGRRDEKEVRKRKEREYCEIDLILTGKIGDEEILLAVEIKSAFDPKDATDFLEILSDFYAYFKEFSRYKVIGVVAASRFGNGTDTFLLKEGIYVLRPSDGMLEIIKPKEVAVFPKEVNR